MVLADVNIWVYAFRPDAPRHAEYRAWVKAMLAGPRPFAVADLVLSGFVRVVTHPRVFADPGSVGEALTFAASVRRNPYCAMVSPGPRHWEIFTQLCQTVCATGNAVPDAYFAALAIESGCEWVSADRGFQRFPGLAWGHPLARR